MRTKHVLKRIYCIMLGTEPKLTPSAITQAIIEGTLGFWYRIYVGPKGRIQFGPQYSRVVRNTWGGGGYDPTANENMFFTSFRYYLP